LNAFDSFVDDPDVRLDRPNLVEKERIFSMLREVLLAPFRAVFESSLHFACL
jgi:hypothetical protein